MRRLASSLLVCASVWLYASGASAQVLEPNGLEVPQPAPGREIDLSHFFESRGEAIGAIGDAHAEPTTFTPLCAFRATFVLNEAGSHFGVGWYNADAMRVAPPSAAEIHEIIPPRASVGTSVRGLDILASPDYAGGEIGFALLGGQTHFTEPRWNVACTSCSPPAPWVLALVYASTLEANAYYVCFEDGPVDGSSFHNDGDFNDDVFYVEGLSPHGPDECCTSDADCDDHDPSSRDRCASMFCVHERDGGMPMDAGLDAGRDAGMDAGRDADVDAEVILHSKWPLGADCCSAAGVRGRARAPAALVLALLALALRRRRG